MNGEPIGLFRDSNLTEISEDIRTNTERSENTKCFFLFSSLLYNRHTNKNTHEKTV